jgi:Fic family protein
MQSEDFQDSPTGRLLTIGGGSSAYRAFVPNHLPPEVDWFEPVMMDALIKAERLLGRLGGVGGQLQNPYLLIGFYTRREAVLSSKIEGTQATLTDLALFEVDRSAVPGSEKKREDAGEIFNYVRAMEHGLGPDRSLPLSLRLIREMHAILMQGVRGENKTPGEFRRSQNWIGPPGLPLRDAKYIPPPPEMLPDLLGEFEKFLHAESEIPLLIRFALAHYQFEAIHPFLDGNGRVGRLLITMLISEHKLLPAPLLYLSAYFEKHREEYYHHLYSISSRGGWKPWVLFFLRGVAEQSADAVERADRLIGVRERIRAELTRERSTSLLLGLAEHLFVSPAVTAPLVARRLDCSPVSARKMIEILEQKGILHEVTGRKRDRVYLAREILDVVS